jgi:hypothetical protein
VRILLPDGQAVALKAEAAAQGLSLEGWIRHVVARKLSPGDQLPPKKSVYDLLAKYGAGPSAEEIEESRRDMMNAEV